MKQPTQEMIDHFYNRTNNHINLVKKWYKRLTNTFYTIPLIDIEFHDQIKFQEPEFIPYVYITWSYYCKEHNIPFEISEELQEKMNEATIHHITHQGHHPEFWDTSFNSSKFNSKNRDKPGNNIVVAINMPLSHILEMCSDWFAMSEEKKTNPWDWYNKNKNIRWKFTSEQEKLIEDALNFYKKSIDFF